MYFLERNQNFRYGVIYYREARGILKDKLETQVNCQPGVLRGSNDWLTRKRK